MLMTCTSRARASGISFSAISCRRDSTLKRSSAFCRSPVTLRISVKTSGSRMWTMWSTAAKKAVSSSARSASVSASTQVLYSSLRIAKFDMLFSLPGAEDLVELFLQGLGRKGLDDVTIHSRLGRLDDLLALGFRGQHQDRHLGQFGVRADCLDQIQARHSRHVPVRDE